MKTAISIPDDVFEVAEQLAERLGMSRSELYSNAVARYVEEHQQEHITEKLNQIYATEDSSVEPVFTQLQSLSIPPEEW